MNEISYKLLEEENWLTFGTFNEYMNARKNNSVVLVLKCSHCDTQLINEDVRKLPFIFLKFQ